MPRARPLPLENGRRFGMAPGCGDDGGFNAHPRMHRVAMARPECLRRTRVVHHALEIDDDHLLIADDPGIVTRGQSRDLAGMAIELAPIIHADVKDPGHVVLEVRRLATGGMHEGLHRIRPLPAGLEDRSADRLATDTYQFDSAPGEPANLDGVVEADDLGSFHDACAVGTWHIELLG